MRATDPTARTDATADEHRDGAEPQSCGAEPQRVPWDLSISRLAEAQWTIVSRDELTALGMQRGAIAVRLRQRRLIRVHRAVYKVGPAPLRLEGHVLAAVKAVGEGSRACGMSASLLHGLVEHARWDPVHVLSPVAGRRSRRGIRVHWSTVPIAPADVMEVRGVPCTAWGRTVVDLGALGRRVVERALDQAVVRGLYDEQELLAALVRAPRSAAAAVVRDVLGAHLAGSTLTDSDLEEMLLALCRDESLPLPVCQLAVDPWRADAAWPEQRLVVELDSARYHASADRRRRDRRKDTGLRRRGFLVLRFDVHDLTVGAKETAAEIRGALRDRGWKG